MRIALAGGGTGGHVFPALAVAGKIVERRPGAEVLYIGGERGIERTIVAGSGYPYRTIPATGFPRRISPSMITFAWNLAVSVKRSRDYLGGFRPSVLLATGGYVSGPPVIAAKTLGVPVVIQEQNAFPGLANKTFGRFADVVYLGFADAADRFGKKVRTMVTGNPVRGEIGCSERGSAARTFGIDPGILTILVFGGSQGSRAVNETVSGAVEHIAERGFQIVWQTGEREFDKWKSYDGRAEGRIRVLPFISAMADAYAAADLVIARAGAMSVAEITACGLPAVFVPLPTAAENHQEFNARSLERAGAAAVILERELTPDRLSDIALGILGDEGRRAVMAESSGKFGKKDAAAIIADNIIARFDPHGES